MNPTHATRGGRRFVILVGDDYEDLELWYPLLRLREAGAQVVVAGLEAGRRYAGKHGYPCVCEAAIASLSANDFDGIILPGGWMPDKVRRDGATLQLTRQLAEAGKLVAAICHGPWIAISAGVVRGVRMTGSLGIKDDLINAGALWEDRALVQDRNFISSRKPDDLPVFGAALVAWINGQPSAKPSAP